MFNHEALLIKLNDLLGKTEAKNSLSKVRFWSRFGFAFVPRYFGIPPPTFFLYGNFSVLKCVLPYTMS